MALIVIAVAGTGQTPVAEIRAAADVPGWSAVPANAAGKVWGIDRDASPLVAVEVNEPDPVAIKTDQDHRVTDFNKGYQLTSPDGKIWRITVDNSGTLTTTKVPA